MKNKAAQVYGYVICVIAIITFLISAGTLINAVIDMGKPLYAGFRNDINLASFENYKADVLKQYTKEAAYIPTDAELQKMYEAARTEVIAKQEHTTRKALLASSFLIVISVILFFVHWKWMMAINRKLPETVSHPLQKKLIEPVEN